jgi:DNA-binding NarL/FixJ family response regulator
MLPPHVLPAPLVASREAPLTRPSQDARSLGLTERQIDVLEGILRGLPNKLICRELCLAEGTVKVHVSAILRALGARNRTQVVIAASRMGLAVQGREQRSQSPSR